MVESSGKDSWREVGRGSSNRVVSKVVNRGVDEEKWTQVVAIEVKEGTAVRGSRKMDEVHPNPGCGPDLPRCCCCACRCR